MASKYIKYIKSMFVTACISDEETKLYSLTQWGALA